MDTQLDAPPIAALDWHDEPEQEEEEEEYMPPARPFFGPTAAEWAALSAAERDRLEHEMIVAFAREELEARQTMAEGDPHAESRETIRDTLRSFFETQRRSIYVGTDLSVSYPRKKTFSPDIVAVTDVPVRARTSWIVAAEGKGLDLALEVCHRGDRRKDFVDNVKKYARLGIREYFAFDLVRGRLVGYRLPEGKKRYVAIEEEKGRLRSEVLGLELAVLDREVRFFLGTAVLATLKEQAQQDRRRAEEERQRAEEERQRAEEERQRAEEERRRARAARAEAIVEILKLRQAPLALGDMDALRARMDACEDLDVLEGWFRQAVTAPPDQLIAAILAMPLPAAPSPSQHPSSISEDDRELDGPDEE